MAGNAGKGRPSKLTPEVHERIVRSMRAGNYFETACRAAGISPATGYLWKAWGEGREVKGRPKPRVLRPYVAFVDAVTRAEAHAEEQAAANWLKHARKAEDWRGEAEYLQRRHPDRWGRQRVDVRHEGEVGITGPVVDALEEYGEVLGELAAAAKPPEETETEETEQ